MRAGCRTGRLRCGRPAERDVCIVTSSLGTPKTKAVLFDIDGTLIDTGGAGARSWGWAFEGLHGVPADIATPSWAGMTDPDGGVRTLEGRLGGAPPGHRGARFFA